MKDSRTEYFRRYREAHRDKLNAYHRQWTRANRDRVNEHKRRYREKKKITADLIRGKPGSPAPGATDPAPRAGGDSCRQSGRTRNREKERITG